MFKLPKLLSFFNLYPVNCKLLTSQSGFAPILALLLILAGIAGGTYLVQQRTNILPFAAESSILVCQNNQVMERVTDEFGQSIYTPFENGNCTSRGLLCKQLTTTSAHCDSPNSNLECWEASNVYGKNYKSIDGKCAIPEVQSNVSCSSPNGAVGSSFYECTKSQGPCDANAGVGIPKKCTGAGKWEVTNTAGECTTECKVTTQTKPPVQTTVKPPTNSTTTSSSSGGQQPATSTPSDPSSCTSEKTCVYSQAKDQCFMGLCKAGTTCGFNSPDCSYANGASKSCLNTKYTHTNGNYSVSGKVGEAVLCPQNQAQGGTAGSTTTSTSSSTTTSNAATAQAQQPQTDTDWAKKCGFTENQDGVTIPLFKIAIGENTSVNEQACKDLLKKILNDFDTAQKAAASKIRDLVESKTNNLTSVKQVDGQYKIVGDPEKLDEQTRTEVQKTVDQLNSSQQKINDCATKTGNEQTQCLKDAQGAVQSTVTEAQKQALKAYVDKLNTLLSKFGQKNSDDMCVKADLGVAPFMDAKRLKASIGQSENDTSYKRLLICLGSIGDLKWRVLVGGESGTQYETENDPNGAGDRGNDAERLWGLYGTESASGGPFWDRYPDGFKINPCVSLHAGSGGKVTPESVKSDLAKYIAAAESGTTNLPDCKKPTNPNDTGTNGSQIRSGQSITGTSSSGTSTGSSTGSTGSGSSSTTAPKTDTPGVDGGKTNKCSSDAGCVEKNGTGYVCDKNNGQCYKPSQSTTTTSPTNTESQNCPGNVCF